ncbi:hypothetical protein L208DRAFT_1297158 [Tricholoma matsutake]|nr:hypothetical protein L208DRAFT_1297158 [Tricholoma matsutake 945]
MSFVPNQTTTVEHLHQSKSLVLTVGDIDSQVMRDFKLCCMNFFGEKDIKAEDQVHKILGAFCDTWIQTWIGGDCEQILILTFGAFMSELRSNYLDPDWVPIIHHRILSATMKLNESFWDWFASVQLLNSIIVNNPLVLL